MYKAKTNLAVVLINQKQVACKNLSILRLTFILLFTVMNPQPNGFWKD